ncbi:MAG TPA: hypothetical protein VGI79_05785 [Caulobacteraceae bacterium]|jgi:hypothetical protein
MTCALTPPPSVTVGPTSVGVSFLTEDGATVQVRLPRPGGLRELPQEEILARARTLARAALENAASSLGMRDLNALAFE